MKIVISLGQMDVAFGRPTENEARVVEWSQEASRRGSQMVLFPELWGSGYDLENFARLATPINGGFFLRMSDLARQNKLFVGGSLLERDGDDLYNTLALYAPDGSLAGSYRKIHLFGLMEEDKWLCAGHRTVLVKSEWGPIALSVCYDLRFPELYRQYALQGAAITLVVAEWPVKRIAHWQTLVRARAIENQMVVAAVNRVGASPDTIFGGASTLVDPWGKTMVEGGQEEEALFTAEVDLAEIERFRRWMPVLEDRRPDVYTPGA